MPRFIAIHTVGPNVVTRQVVEESAAHAKRQREITSYRSFINMTEGRAACIIDAPGRAWLENYFNSIQLPFDSIFEVEIESLDGHVQEETAQLCP
jgi:hypothetical protein